MNSLFFFSNSSCISWSQLPCVLWQMSCRSIDLTKKNTFSCIFHSHPHDRLFVFEKLRKLRPIPSIIVKWHFFFFLQDTVFFSLVVCKGRGDLVRKELVPVDEICYVWAARHSGVWVWVSNSDGCCNTVTFETLISITTLQPPWTSIYCRSLKPSISKDSRVSIAIWFLNRIYHAHYRKLGKSRKMSASPPKSNYL